jgi:hypothetical protein
MGGLGHPGVTYKVVCSSKAINSASFSGDVSLSLAGSAEQLEYYKEGHEYVVHFRPFDGADTDDSDKAASAS